MTDSKGILSISSLYLLKQIVDVAEEFGFVAYLKSPSFCSGRLPIHSCKFNEPLRRRQGFVGRIYGMLTGKQATGEAPVQIVAAAWAVKIDNFATKIQAPDQSTFESLGPDLFKRNTAAGDHGGFPAGVAGYGQGRGNQQFQQSIAVAAGLIFQRFYQVEPGLSA